MLLWLANMRLPAAAKLESNLNPRLTPPPFCVYSDLEQLRKIRRRSPHDDTEAFTVFLRSDVEAKLVQNHSPLYLNIIFTIIFLICF